jgi:hypothetical protein
VAYVPSGPSWTPPTTVRIKKNYAKPSGRRGDPIIKHINCLGTDKNLAMGPETENDCAGEDQQQFTVGQRWSHCHVARKEDIQQKSRKLWHLVMFPEVGGSAFYSYCYATVS